MFRQNLAIHPSLKWGVKEIELWMSLMLPHSYNRLTAQSQNVFFVKVFALPSTKRSVNGAQIVVTGMNAPSAQVPTLCQSAIKKHNLIRNQFKKAATSVNLLRMSPWLKIYPDREKANFIFNIFKYGFPVKEFDGQGCEWVENLNSVFRYKDIVEKKIQAEIIAGRVLGPFASPCFENFCLSPLGIVPK